MSEDSCPTCGRPDGAGHLPKCFEKSTSMRPYLDFFDSATLERKDLTSRERELTRLLSTPVGMFEQWTQAPRDHGKAVKPLNGFDAMRSGMSKKPIKGLDALWFEEGARRFYMPTRRERFRRWLHKLEVAALPGSGHALVEDGLMILFFALCLLKLLLGDAHVPR